MLEQNLKWKHIDGKKLTFFGTQFQTNKTLRLVNCRAWSHCDLWHCFLAMEILQFCIKPLLCHVMWYLYLCYTIKCHIFIVRHLRIIILVLKKEHILPNLPDFYLSGICWFYLKIYFVKQSSISCIWIKKIITCITLDYKFWAYESVGLWFLVWLVYWMWSGVLPAWDESVFIL